MREDTAGSSETSVKANRTTRIYFVENHTMIPGASMVECISVNRRLKYERLNASGMLHSPNRSTMNRKLKDPSKHH